MARTHINPVTQKEGTCTAKPGNCMYKNEDGTEAPHFNSKKDARAYIEKEMNKEYGNTKTLQKNNIKTNKQFNKLAKKNTNFISFKDSTPIKDKQKTNMFNAGIKKINKFDKFKKGLYNNAVKVDKNDKVNEMFKVM